MDNLKILQAMLLLAQTLNYSDSYKHELINTLTEMEIFERGHKILDKK